MVFGLGGLERVHGSCGITAAAFAREEVAFVARLSGRCGPGVGEGEFDFVGCAFAEVAGDADLAVGVVDVVNDAGEAEVALCGVFFVECFFEVSEDVLYNGELVCCG